MYGLNEKITLKKQHPCGGREWEVVRTGADIKLRCTTCGKFVNLTRDELKKRAKRTGEKECIKRI
ncbi:MAG: DUF951 domain-containing protein [Clostridia bacterium]|nr:DUF951 domain-containing protein [Clostridia bacterium]